MRIDISSYDLDNLNPIKNSRHKGNFGGCYLFNGLAFKYFEAESDILKRLPLEERLEALSKLKVDGVSLPIDLVYCNDKFVGYTMPYYNGPTLTRILLEIKLGRRTVKEREILNFYSSILRKIEELSYYKIKANDIKPDNIIYYNEEANLVDCDFYSINNNIAEDDVLKFNLRLLNKALLKVFEDFFGYSKTDHLYKDADLETKDFINVCMNNFNL